MDRGAIKAALARAYSSGAEPAYLAVAPNGRDELWSIDSMAFVVPVVPNDAPPELEFALRVRRNALLTGQCDECGAVVDTDFESVVGGLSVAGSVIPHRRNCVAADSTAGPQIEEYYKKKQREPFRQALAAASQKTREEIDSRLTDRIDLPSEEYSSWAQGLIDRKSNGEVVSTCDHLLAAPAQTWTMLLGLDRWHCDECWTYLQHRIYQGGPILSQIEEYTCDYCGRYVESLQPLVIRVSNFVMQGGMCRRCARDAETAGAGMKGGSRV